MDGNGLESNVEDNETTSVTTSSNGQKERRKRTARPYPTTSFEEALELAQHIQQYAAGKKVRRLTLLDYLKRSDTSSTTRVWITDASKYGVTEGSYTSEFLELTPEGYKASSDKLPAAEVIQARINLAILYVTPFQILYNEYAGEKLPATQILADTLRNNNIDDQLVGQLVDLFLVNLQFLGLLKTVAGAERILPVEHLLESLPHSTVSSPIRNIPTLSVEVPTVVNSDRETPLPAGRGSVEDQHFDTTCFYITPIGDVGSETRHHSDLFLEHLVKPALAATHLTVIRADQIDKPGLITRQVIDYLLRSKLVIADLSFHNPNVFYELALRHVRRMPTVQIIRQDDAIPFDVNQSRTIRIDCTSIYTLIPKLETYRAEIANQVRRALENPDVVDNPLTTFYPSLRTTIESDALLTAAPPVQNIDL